MPQYENTPMYDVFITCKSEDYKYAEIIYDYLTDHGAKVFLASRELRRLGESEYRKAISNAMQQTYHLIIFASKPEYIDSTWVYYEWDMFITAKLKGYKPGNVITILKDIKTDEINMSLWKYESLDFDSYKDYILPYIETPQLIENKKHIFEAQQKEETEKRRKEQEEQKVKTLKSEFIRCAEDYQKKKAALSVDISKIRALLSSLNVTTISCPVCEYECHIDCDYCDNCGWQLPLISAISEAKYLDKTASKQLAIYKKVYNEASLNSSVTSDIEKLSNENHELIQQLQASKELANKNEEENSKLKEKIEELNSKLTTQSAKCAEYISDNSNNNQNSTTSFFRNRKIFWSVCIIVILIMLSVVFIFTKLNIHHTQKAVEAYIEIEAANFEADTLVDLGLSVLWASQNIGAKAPYKRGNFYGWGVKDTSITDTIYSHYPSKNPPISISGNTNYDIATHYTIDNKRLRIPTKEEAEELVNRCTWTKVTVNGQIGCEVTGPNGKSIFFPAAGWSDNGKYKEFDANKHDVTLNYWTSSLYGVGDKIWRANSFHFNDSKKQHMGTGRRYYGFNIRPVADKHNESKFRSK